MSLPSELLPVGLLGTGAAGGYTIDRSLRFNSSDSAYLSRTPASAGNRKTWTWAGWVKRGKLDGTLALMGAYTNDDNRCYFYFNGSNQLQILDKVSASFQANASSVAVFRDCSAWYHIVWTIDTTQATGSDRIKLYVNGVQQTLTFSTTPGSSADLYINTTAGHRIGDLDGSVFFDGYLADIHLIDGQALDPTSFTEVDATTGQLIPKAYTGSYGTNGFHLPFSDNSTAAALGTDTSGNGNTWTVNNISVTAGAGNDSLVDVPTNGTETDTGVGGEVRGNYCTWNPLNISLNASLSNGNLQSVSGGVGGVNGTIFVSSGKWYWETTLDASTGFATTGIGEVSSIYYPGYSANSYAYYTSGVKYNNDTSSSYGASWGVGDIIGVALDLDAGTLTFYKNGVSQGTAFSSLSGTFAPRVGNGASSTSVTWTLNAGARSFAYTAPSGYKALCTQNLDTPVVAKPSEVMDVKLYTANRSTNNITGLGFSPDLVWIKGRQSQNHMLFDTVRTAGKSLNSNLTAAEETFADTLTSFNSDGFTLGPDSTSLQVNYYIISYAAWCWDAGSSTVTNTQGSITSSVRANASSGFSVVTYPGALSGAGSSTIGHGLGVAPSLVIVKNRDAAENWVVYHQSLGNAAYVVLNSTSAQVTGSSLWGTTSPTSSVFTAGYSSQANLSGNNYVAYCFAPVPGYSSFGSYTGNGSAAGPFVFCGFRPRWLMVKRTDAVSNWFIYDSARNTFNIVNNFLRADLSNAEAAGSIYSFDFLSNGFKLRSSEADINASGGTFIYACFAESPFQYSRAR